MFKLNGPGCPCRCTSPPPPPPCAGRQVCVIVTDLGTGAGKSGLPAEIDWTVSGGTTTTTGTTDSDGKYCATPPTGGTFASARVTTEDPDCSGENDELVEGAGTDPCTVSFTYCKRVV